VDKTPLKISILDAWQIVVHYIADDHAAKFSGRAKETLVFRRLRKEIGATTSALRITGPDSQERFGDWSIDLVCDSENEKIAVEGKFKVQTDGAVPDNRKAAFFDLYKLEAYVDSGEYSAGLFVWLTDEPGYLVPASGDSRDFSTHRGRVYDAGMPLHAHRSRGPMPLPLILKRRYEFEWRSVGATKRWHYLVIAVEGKARNGEPISS